MLAVVREPQSDHVGGVILYLRVQKGMHCGPSYFSKMFLRLVAPTGYSKNHYTPKQIGIGFQRGFPRQENVYSIRAWLLGSCSSPQAPPTSL